LRHRSNAQVQAARAVVQRYERELSEAELAARLDCPPNTNPQVLSGPAEIKQTLAK